jgi:uncharacterized membrane protein YphA (DoxX/SURF4 family)
MNVLRAQEQLDSWLVRNAHVLKRLLAAVFGVFWGIDGALKFQPGLVALFPGMVTDAGQGQPAWLTPWFTFWAQAAQGNAALLVYSTGTLELALAFALIAGFMRKVAYGGGFVLSLFIWAVPEGFGGPYGPGATDIGTGIVYAIFFLALMLINATYGPSRYTLDHLIERRWPGWARVAEIRPRRLPGPEAPHAG